MHPYCCLMQSLLHATNGADAATPVECARAMLGAMPQVVWFMRRQMRRHRTHGLSVPQYRTLVLLDRFPNASLSALAENLGMCLPTASRTVAGLVAKGLASRAPSESDRRQVVLALTRRGRAAFNS